MSLALIEESAKEIRRLAVAGSPLAVGDFRLKKLIAPLEQAGAKVPVFAQVAKAMGDLVNGEEAESAALLLNLSTLINAILYTQGQPGTDGDFQEHESFPTSCASTRTTARVLKPVVQALTSSGGGRFEIVKAACDRGGFNDLRLIDPAIQALGDSYPELADLVAEKILPGYGPGIVPRLKAGLELKGKRSDGRRLKLMHQLDPAGTLDLCKTALDEGSAEVKAAAIACLAKHEECLSLVLAEVRSKNKMLRDAALEALAEHDRPEVTSLFGELIKGKALDFLARPFRIIRNRQLLGSLVAEGNRVFDLLLKGDAEQLPRFREILDCFDERKEPEVEEFLAGCFGQCEKLAKLKAPKNSVVAGVDVTVTLASLLYGLGSPRAFEAILNKRAVLPPLSFGQVLRSAILAWPADNVYQEFAPLLAQKKGVAKEKAEEIQSAIWLAMRRSPSEYDYLANADLDSIGSEHLNQVTWDPRWLDAAIKAEQTTIVCCLATPGHKGAIAFLLKQIEAKGRSDAGLIIETLARCQYPKTTDVFLDLVARKTKGAKFLDYDLQSLLGSSRHLPAADLAKLDAFAAKLDEKFLDHYLEALGPLRPAKTENAEPTNESTEES